MTKCPKCGSIITLDEVSNTYYCEKCNHLYSIEDIKEKSGVKVSIKAMFAWLPVINIILLLLEDKRKEHNDVYYNVCLSAIFCHLMILLAVTAGVKYYVTESKKDLLQEIRSSIESTLTKNDLVDLRPIMPSIPEIPEPTEPDLKTGVITEDMVNLISGSKLMGATVRDIITNNSNYGFLIATLASKQKYTNPSYYINVGRLFKECKNDDEGKELKTYEYYDEIIDNITFTFDGNKQATAWIEDPITIYYVYDSQFYTTQCLRDKDGNIVGLAFIEQEE
ncbi:MAG: hypothetical protein IIT65_15690 [Lachnospiraceae bacterium]|nr:hypothetical protein [Lachnospiraceae bacterium]